MPHLAHLSQPQATVLALWSFGMVLARSCALSAVSRLLAAGRQRSEPTVRQRWRAWDDDTQRQRGPKRQARRVETGFAPVLGGVVRGWPGTPLALALEATPWGTRCGVWAVRVGDRGWASPGAWGLLPAGATPAGRREWRREWRRLGPASPPGGPGLIVAKRGWSAPWRCRRLTRLGWPPVVRLNPGGSFRPTGAPCWRPLPSLAPQPGTRGRGTALACPRPPVACTLLARWEAGDKDPWLLRTALAPPASDAAWYGRRAWLAQGVQSTKGAGWPWHRPRMSPPARAARRWRAVAVATWWRLSVGGEADEARPASPLLDVPAWCPARPRTRRATRLRLVRGFRQGWGRLRVALRRQEPLPPGRGVPAPWPAGPPLAGDPYAPGVVLPEAA
jgi:hypothetical protein